MRIEFDLLEFGVAGFLAVLLVLVLVGHGQAVDGAPVGEIGFAIEGAGLSHGLVFFAKNVAGLGIDVPADPRDGAADVEDGGVDVADFFGACGGEGEGGIVGVLRDVDQIVVQLREHFVFLRGRHAARAHARHAHEGGVGSGDDGQRALRRLHIDVHAVGKGEGHIDRSGRAAAVTFGDAHVHGLDGLQLGQASHGGGDFRGQGFAFGIGGGGLGGVVLLSAFSAGGGGMVMSISFTAAERGQRLVEFFRVADDQHGELILVQVLGGDAVHVGCSDLLDFRLIFVEPVGRISVIFVGHALAENFVGRVEAEDEGVEDGVFGALDFVVGDGMFGEIVDVFAGGLNRFDRASALGADRNLQNAGMAEVGANASADAVGQAALGANVVEQARREAAAEGFVEHADGVVVGIVARGAERRPCGWCSGSRRLSGRDSSRAWRERI